MRTTVKPIATNNMTPATIVMVNITTIIVMFMTLMVSMNMTIIVTITMIKGLYSKDSNRLTNGN